MFPYRGLDPGKLNAPNGRRRPDEGIVAAGPTAPARNDGACGTELHENSIRWAPRVFSGPLEARLSEHLRVEVVVSAHVAEVQFLGHVLRNVGP